MSELLSAGSVGQYLVARGLVPADVDVRATDLEWGVSNVVLAVEADGFRAVVKQALPQLRVPDEWLAKRERAITEAAALALVREITPGRVPSVFDIDPDACALTVERAPDGWRNWKEELLAQRAHPRVAAELGWVLRAWHDATRDERDVRARFDDADAFEQLRVDPYHRTVARRRPELESAVLSYVERMARTRRCLVHGDYSPKNVLLGDDGLWVVDFEVAHVGDPAFDVAFMTNHLMLKAIHRPSSADAYHACAAAFWDAYGDIEDTAYVLGQTGCLMVARVDGKSPAEYLSPAERETARDAGSAMLLEPPGDLDDAWTLVS